MTPLKILLLEDRAMDAELTLAELDRHRLPYDVCRASDRATFVEALQKGPFDLILADYDLPDFDGLSALRMAKEKDPNCPFIFVSGQIGEEIAIESLQQGATDYVLKHRLGRLAPAIERTLAESRQRAEKEQTQAALRNLEERYRFFIQSVRDYAIVLLDNEGQITSWNEGAERILGYGESEILGQSHALFYTPEDRAANIPFKELKAAKEKGRAGNDRWHQRKSGERFWASGVVSPLRNERGELVGFAKVMRDMTEQKQAQDAIRELNAELEKRVAERTKELLESQKALQKSQVLEAMGRLAGGVAHDFNNLVTGILGISEELRNELKNPVHQSEIDEIIKAAQKAATLTRQLLAFGRRQTSEPQPIDLNQVITDMNKLFSRVLGENIQIVSKLDPALGAIRADQGQLEQIIINLVLNARDAMASGGRLTFETKNVELNGAQNGRHLDAPSGPYVLLSVSDTGSGMDSQILSHIFEPFFTTKEIGKGTGLGLSTVYGIVKQHQGDIEVESERSHGTTFRIYFPRQEKKVIIAPRRPTVSVTGGHETILVIEDEEIVRRVATRALKRAGYTVYEACDGRQAIQLFDTIQDSVNLLLTDILMPGMNGRQVATILSRKKPGLLVLYMSGHDEDIISNHGVLEPGIAFISKTFTPTMLCQKVREVLDQAVEERRVSSS